MKNTSDLPSNTDTPGYTSLLQAQDLFLQAPIGIIRTTVDGRILEVNSAFVQMLGYRNLADFSQQRESNIAAIYEDPVLRQKLIEKLSQEESPRPLESRWRRKDGSLFFCRLHGRKSLNSDGSVHYFECFVEDISAQKAMENALVAGREKYRSIFENTGTATIIIENDTTISLANHGFTNLTGYSKDDIEGKMSWTAFIALREDLEKMLLYHKNRREETEPPPIEYEFVLKDKTGKHKAVFLRVDMISGTDCSVASLLDITSLKRTQRDLRQSESRLSGIMEAFDGYVYVCSPDRDLLYTNRKIKDVLPVNHFTAPCHKSIFNLESTCSWCPDKKVFNGETAHYEFQNPHDSRWYYGVSSPVFEEEDSIASMQTVLIDIHQRKIEEMVLKRHQTYLHKENLRLRHTMQDRYKFGSIIGKSQAMQKVYELVLRAAATEANVILYGESGTGKELVAKAIHSMSDRAPHPFIAVNCSAIPADLMESEFFGYCKGAFTGAAADKPGYFSQANRGTLFLDELGEITEAMQVKLLRVLEGNGYIPIGGSQTHFPDVRIISATNREARSMLEQGSMREDFFYRIHILPITLPPLRERIDDIPLLIEHFLKQYGNDSSPQLLTGQELDMMLQHRWPGNVRELENTIQRFLNLNILEFSRTFTDSSIEQPPASDFQTEPDLDLRHASRIFERNHIVEALQHHRWNRSAAAKALGIQRKTLYLKMKELEIGQ
ncbi:MAG: sigma 54-interacting transcriptional regulator [Desulfopila sp.]|nr:sigma 54-interacting transcriptional regulator [Desulfopila sp.]